jgi:DNA polymerase elongation subunit (family B)
MADNTDTQLATVTVRAYDWRETVENGNAAVHCWALTQESQPILVRFPNYHVSCRFELPKTVYIRGRGLQPATWDSVSAGYLVSMMKQRLGNHGPTFSQYQFLRQIYYHNRWGHYVTVYFQNREAMRHAINLMRKGISTDRWGWVKMEAYEAQFDSVRKLCTLKKLQYCQWFTVCGRIVTGDEQISKITEIVGDANSIIPLPEEQTGKWRADPGILSWDIEVYSHNPRIFPDRFNQLHEAYMVSLVYEKPDQNGVVDRKRFNILIGDCNESKVFEGAVKIRVNNEVELVSAFCQVVEATNPEILVGHNIFAFDYPYLNQRIKAQAFDWPNISRMKKHKVDAIETFWASKAYGPQKRWDLDMPGRISLDLLPIITRDFKLQLNSLNYVSKKFLNKEKHDVPPERMFAIYKRLKDAMKLPQDHPERIAAVAEMTQVADYCIQDSELVLDLMKKLHIWVGLVEMASIMGVTPVQLFTRGQQVRCLSQIYDLAYHHGFVINSRDVPGCHYSGALVYPTKVGACSNVLCLDFASLYPSIMQAYNLSHDTLVAMVPGPDGTMIQDPSVPDEDCHVISFTQMEPESQKTAAQRRYGDGDRDYEVDLDDIEDDAEDEDADGDDTKKKKKTEKLVERKYCFRFYKKRDGLLKILEETNVAKRRAVNRIIAGLQKELKYHEDCQKLYLALKEGKIPDQKDADEYSSRREKDEKFEEYYQRFVKLSYDEKMQEYQRLHSELKVRSDRIEELEAEIVPLNKRQLSIKTSCNSVYGFTGVQHGGKLPCIEVAMCVTALGRELITKAADYVKDTYGGEQVAGDTDSFMVKLPFVTAKNSWYWGQRLAQEISGIPCGGKDVDGNLWPDGKPGLFPPPLKMEFEKCMDGIWLKRKFYSAYLQDNDGNHKTKTTYDEFGAVKKVEKEMLLRGTILVRRDNCDYTRKVYKPVTINILEQRPFEESWGLIFASVIKLLKGEASIEDLTMIKGLGESYATKTNPMYVFSKYLESIGKPQEAGSRLPYLVVGTGTDAVGSKMRLAEQLIESPEPINTEYYLSNVMAGPIDTLVGIGYKDFIDQLDISFRARNGGNCKPITLHTPIKFMVKYMKANKNVTNKIGLLEHLNRLVLDRCAAVRSAQSS